VPKAIKFKSVKAGKNALTIKWTKAPGAAKITKYQVRWKVHGTKTWSAPKAVASGKASLSVKKLKKGKRYDVQIRVYKTVSKANYYSAWSKAKLSAKVG
jgi:hypothetical protein